MEKNMRSSKDLSNAKSSKKDEFYTSYHDIELEIENYKSQLKAKVVICNCNDSLKSNFTKYFLDNFNRLSLKRLICISYGHLSNQHGYVLDKKKGLKPSIQTLQGDGDFKSDESIYYLKQADVVVTNPPFSLFRQFLSILSKYKKKFIILGNVNALTYKEVFSLILKNQLWLGASIHSSDREFKVPSDYPLAAYGSRRDANGVGYIRVTGVRWFTNVNYLQRYKKLVLKQDYNPNDYPNYDNYNAIEVGRVANIPRNYDGVMGVPITFMDKFNPEQFKILGLDRHVAPKESLKGGRLAVYGKRKYARILIKRILNDSK